MRLGTINIVLGPNGLVAGIQTAFKLDPEVKEESVTFRKGGGCP